MEVNGDLAGTVCQHIVIRKYMYMSKIYGKSSYRMILE